MFVVNVVVVIRWWRNLQSSNTHRQGSR